MPGNCFGVCTPVWALGFLELSPVRRPLQRRSMLRKSPRMSVASRRARSGTDEAADTEKATADNDEEPRGILLTPLRVFFAAACLLLAAAAAIVVASLPPRLPSRLRANTSLYIACNLYNNEDIMPKFNAEIVRLGQMVGAANLYVSVFENGSSDNTKGQLKQLQALLDEQGVRHTVHTSDATWKDYRDHVNGPHRVLRQRQSPVPPNGSAPHGALLQQLAAANALASTALRSAGVHARIPIMARVRNEALKPLLSAPWLAASVSAAASAPPPEMGTKWAHTDDSTGTAHMKVVNPLFEPLFGQAVGGVAAPPLPLRTAQWAVESIASALAITPPAALQQRLQGTNGTFAWSDGPGIGQGQAAAGNGPMQPQDGNLGLPHPITVVFVNDVKLKAEHIIGLANTAGGEYDVACALDFALLKLYDTWVIRDVAGRTLSGWWPFLREPETQAMLKAGKPFPVSQCWNGMVALDAASWVGKGLLFRPWQHQEQRGVTVPVEEVGGGSASALWDAQWWAHLRRLWNTVRVEWMSPPADAREEAREEAAPPTQTQRETAQDGDIPVAGIPAAAGSAMMHGADGGGVYGGANCAASECGLFAKDLIEAGHPRVLVNPAVQLVYDTDSQLLQNLLMVWVNPLLLQWANRPHRHGPMVRGCVYPACRHVPGTPTLSSLPLQQHTAAWRVLHEGGAVRVHKVHTWWVPPPAASTCGLDGFEAEALAEAAEQGRLPPWRQFVVAPHSLLPHPSEEL